MYFDQEDERDPFLVFGEPEAANDDEVTFQERDRAPDEPAAAEPEAPRKVNAGFSWAAFAGGLAALLWTAATIAWSLSYFGLDGVGAMEPAMQAGLVALAFGPALLFWVAASAAGEALKARRLAAELTRLAQEASLPIETGEARAKHLSSLVKSEIQALTDAVSAALARVSELETAAQRNASLFDTAVSASRESAEAMSTALQREREAMMELNSELKGQTETISQSINRQVRLMREASKLVKTEVTAAEEALEARLASFAASATALGERTTAFHQASDGANAAASSLNGTLTQLLDGLSEATRLTDAARQSSEQAVLAANETAGAVRETTRNAVTEAKQVAQLIRAEATAMQDSATDTLAKLQQAADSARTAAQESQVAANRHAAAIEKRLRALASTANAKPAPVAKHAVEHQVVEPVKAIEVQAVETEGASLQAAASAAMARGGSRSHARVEPEQPRRLFKGFGGWSNFTPRIDEAPAPANEVTGDLVRFARGLEASDQALKEGAISLVTEAGVDLSQVLPAEDLERVAHSSRQGAAARRGAVQDTTPGAVNRVARYIRRNGDAHDLAAQFRSRPDLARSEDKGECSKLVRAYLLIDAALA